MSFYVLELKARWWKLKNSLVNFGIKGFNDEEFWEIEILLGKRFDFRNNCLTVLEIKKITHLV